MEGGGLTRHIRRAHGQKEGIFNQPFPCPECRRQGKDNTSIDGSAAWYNHVALVHGEVEGPYSPSHRPRSPDSFSDDGSRQKISTRKRKRDEEDIEAEFEVDAEAAAIAVGSDWLEDVMIMTDTTGTTPDAATDSTSGTQTPVSSADSDIIQRIDPRLLSDEPRQGRKG